MTVYLYSRHTSHNKQFVHTVLKASPFTTESSPRSLPISYTSQYGTLPKQCPTQNSVPPKTVIYLPKQCPSQYSVSHNTVSFPIQCPSQNSGPSSTVSLPIHSVPPNTVSLPELPNLGNHIDAGRAMKFTKIGQKFITYIYK